MHIVHCLLPARRVPGRTIHSEEHVPDGTWRAKYNSEVPNKGHDHTFFVQHTREVFAD